MAPPRLDLTIDIHRYGERLKQQEELLAASRMQPSNKRLVADFLNWCKVDPKIGDARLIRYVYCLRRIGELSDKPFKLMVEKDIAALLARLHELKSPKGTPLSSGTLQEFRKAISKFWRWLYFDEYHGEAPPMIRRMRGGAAQGRREPEIYSEEEIRQIIAAMTNARNRAFFSCLYDLQCRVGELLSRRTEHVRFTDEGDVQILIEADKTKTRHWETLFESVPAFTTWMRLHPLPDEPHAPLWTVLKVNARGERVVTHLRYGTARKLFLTACQRAGIRRGKPNRMHMFRKSKATHDLAAGVPITYIESRGSWSKGSRALQDCYLAVIQKDKDNAYRRRYGMQANNGTQARRELRRCNRCQSVIDDESRYCPRCGFPIDGTAASAQNQLDLASLVDADLLSEMVKRYVLQELAKQATNDHRVQR